MTVQEFSDQFDVLYNNVTSNQAAGLNEYEKSLFLTKGQYEMVKNYFLPQSNPKQEGFDGNPKRQADFATLIRSAKVDVVPRTSESGDTNVIDIRTAGVYGASWPGDIFIMLNELVFNKDHVPLVIKPLSFEAYATLMTKAYKYPPKNEVWRLIVSNNQSGASATVDTNGVTTVVENTSTTTYTNQVQVQLVSLRLNANDKYTLRYVKKPRPIILEDLTYSELSIDGATGPQTSELPAELHEEILQRAVELAKTAWTSTGQDNTQAVIQVGQRSE